MEGRGLSFTVHVVSVFYTVVIPMLNPLIYSFLGETFRDKLRLYVEQKTSLPALNRFCHATLKAVIPDSTEQSEVRFSSAV